MKLTQLSLIEGMDRDVVNTFTHPKRNGRDVRTITTSITLPADLARFVLDQARSYGWKPDTAIAFCIAHCQANTLWDQWAVQNKGE